MGADIECEEHTEGVDVDARARPVGHGGRRWPQRFASLVRLQVIVLPRVALSENDLVSSGRLKPMPEALREAFQYS